MLVECIKTGFHAYASQYNCWLYGDAHRLGDVYIFRVCAVDYESPLRSIKHFCIDEISQWFDQSKTSMDRNSTLLAHASGVTNYGYDGVSSNA